MFGVVAATPLGYPNVPAPPPPIAVIVPKTESLPLVVLLEALPPEPLLPAPTVTVTVELTAAE
jgi:hypothetical protein